MRSNLPNFSSQCSHLTAFKSHQWWSPSVVVVSGPCDALRAGIEITINLLGHPISMTQHYHE